MKDSTFLPEVRLLLSVLPFIVEERQFALKGGTAINLFFRNMPRLSVDIDLTYLPVEGREKSLKSIADALSRIKKRIENFIPGTTVKNVVPKGVGSASGLNISTNEAQIKIEVNIVIRGTLFPPIEMRLCERAREDFSTDVQMEVLSKPDLFGGKLCAALDRQHPRDLFDVKLLLDEDDLNAEVRKGFVVYLACHDRPMNELLNPTWKNLETTFNDDFQGMTYDEVKLSDLLSARDKMLSKIRDGLTS